MRSVRQNILMQFDIRYTSKEITPWGGIMQKIGLRELIEQKEDLPQSGSNRGYKATAIIERFITSIRCGANRFYLRKLPDMEKL